MIQCTLLVEHACEHVDVYFHVRRCAGQTKELQQKENPCICLARICQQEKHTLPWSFQTEAHTSLWDNINPARISFNYAFCSLKSNFKKVWCGSTCTVSSMANPHGSIFHSSHQKDFLFKHTISQVGFSCFFLWAILNNIKHKEYNTRTYTYSL